jgi:hypothetical protein
MVGQGLVKLVGQVVCQIGWSSSRLVKSSVVHRRYPGDFGRTRDVQKFMSGTVSAGQLGHRPILLDIFWPELTSDVASINADKKSRT